MNSRDIGPRRGRAAALATAVASLAIALAACVKAPLTEKAAPAVADAWSNPDDRALAGAGCGARSAASGTQTVTFAGRSRRFIVDLPQGYAPATPYRLILAFHGRTGTAEKVRSYFDLEGLGVRPAIIVYPQALPRGWGNTLTGPAGDFRFVDALLARIEASYCIDRTQVFAVGHSMGGSFVNSLACGHPAAFRGFGTVAGGIGSVRTCGGPVAAIMLHSPDDRAVAFSQARQELDKQLRQNGFTGAGEDARTGFACRRWGNAQEPFPVAFCRLPSTRNGSGRPYTHGWPEGTAATIIGFFDTLPSGGPPA
jgi:polyhydroxybutyrate depolymerase